MTISKNKTKWLTNQKYAECNSTNIWFNEYTIIYCKVQSYLLQIYTGKLEMSIKQEVDTADHIPC